VLRVLIGAIDQKLWGKEGFLAFSKIRVFALKNSIFGTLPYIFKLDSSRCDQDLQSELSFMQFGAKLRKLCHFARLWAFKTYFLMVMSNSYKNFPESKLR
jgi:hypothetical protein